MREFVEYYSKLKCDPNQPEQVDDENFDIDKRTILDLCAHMFLPTNTDDNSSESLDDQFQISFEVGEFNDMRTDDRIKEFENE